MALQLERQDANTVRENREQSFDTRTAGGTPKPIPRSHPNGRGDAYALKFTLNYQRVSISSSLIRL
jgi:hypothetical protein